MPHFILTRLATHFFTKVSPSSCLSSFDVSLTDYLSACRNYKHFVLRPVLIERNDRSVVPEPCLLNDAASLADFSIIDARYVIETYDASILPERVVDVLDASMAFTIRRAERDLEILDIDTKVIPVTRRIARDEFVNICANKLCVHPDQIKYSRVLDGCKYLPEVDLLIWQLADAIFDHDVLIYAMMFFREAIHSLVDIIDVDEEPSSLTDTPLSISESVKLENALHNFYKVIEAIYGGTLANNESKVRAKLQQRGVDPSEVIGFQHLPGVREPVIVKTLNLQRARDARAAHGRVHNQRKGTYFEIMDSMELASHFISRSVEKVTSIQPLTIPGATVSFRNSLLEAEGT